MAEKTLASIRGRALQRTAASRGRQAVRAGARAVQQTAAPALKRPRGPDASRRLWAFVERHLGD